MGTGRQSGSCRRGEGCCRHIFPGNARLSLSLFPGNASHRITGTANRNRNRIGSRTRNRDGPCETLLDPGEAREARREARRAASREPRGREGKPLGVGNLPTSPSGPSPCQPPPRAPPPII